MAPIPVSPGELQELLQRFASSGVVGVALGAKQTGGQIRSGDPVVTFFVDQKVPAPAGQPTLENGREIIPATLTLAGGTIATDVVEGMAPIPSKPAKAGKPVFGPGGRLVSDNRFGTMAMLVRSNVDGRVFALTNHHVAPPNRPVDFYRASSVLMRRPVSASVQFMPATQFHGAPMGELRVHVDASLISLAPSQLGLVANGVPNYGPIHQIASLPSAATPQYGQLIGQSVYSYSWASNQRVGTIEHVLYSFIDEDGKPSTFSMLIRGAQGALPGVAGDSGKLWMRQGPTGNEAVALHIGEYFQAKTATRYAAATDISALARAMDFSLY